MARDFGMTRRQLNAVMTTADWIELLAVYRAEHELEKKASREADVKARARR